MRVKRGIMSLSTYCIIGFGSATYRMILALKCSAKFIRVWNCVNKHIYYLIQCTNEKD